MQKQDKIAVLIDGENISRKYIKLILDEVIEFGTPTYKRVYADFSEGSASAWKDELRKYALTPIFQINYTKNKNASDSAMIIDAMDILYTGNVTGFCLVTSDSDFTKLANRLREAGMLVIGMGEKKTPISLVSACETFKYLDLLYKAEDENKKQQNKKQPAGGSNNPSGRKQKKIHRMWKNFKVHRQMNLEQIRDLMQNCSEAMMQNRSFRMEKTPKRVQTESGILRAVR